MMRRYLLSSAGVHFSILGLFLFLSWLNRSNDMLIIDGFDYIGGGGGGDGKAGSGGGPKAEHIGQVVPAPVKVPIPAKPAPVQKAVVVEEAWAVKNAKTPKPAEKTPAKPETPVERGDKDQKEQSNVIRKGVDSNTEAGDGGFDFGSGSGGGGEGDGKGLGLGIGFGPGEGGFGGFGGYLRILRQRIWSEWTQSAVYGSNEVCIVGLTVARDGEISDIKVEKASNNPFYDNVALRAVRNASPLPPLPSSFAKSSQRFRIKFRLIE